MELTIVGCSGSFPGPASPASSYLATAEGFRLLIDLGNGALGALQQYASPGDIDAVLISHLHADHCLDMCSYQVFRTYHPDGPLPPIPVYAPGGRRRPARPRGRRRLWPPDLGRVRLRDPDAGHYRDRAVHGGRATT